MMRTPTTDRAPIAIDELYHSNTKQGAGRIAFVDDRGRERRNRAIHALYEAGKGRYKTYPAATRISLPAQLRDLDVPLETALRTRRSQRTFTTEPPILIDVATMLARSYGVADTRASGVVRAVPSGGGLYPLDLYWVQFPGAAALPEGVFHYHVGGHFLQQIADGCARADWQRASIYPEIVGEAPALLVVVADMRRTRVKYGERAYRLALLEAGHVSQNLYLIAPALGMGVVAIDGFYDDRVHALLDLDGISEIVLLVFAIGKPR